MNNTNFFSMNLNMYIRKSGKTQREFAKDINERATTVNNWCRNIAMPSPKKLQKLADYFGITTTDLLERNDTFFDRDYNEICEKINAFDPDFREIIIDYYNKSIEEKKLICEFYRAFVRSRQ